MKHLLKMLDLSTEEIIEILDLPEGIYPYPCFL